MNDQPSSNSSQPGAGQALDSPAPSAPAPAAPAAQTVISGPPKATNAAAVESVLDQLAKHVIKEPNIQPQPPDAASTNTDPALIPANPTPAPATPSQAAPPSAPASPAQSSQPPLIVEIKNLHKNFGNIGAVNDLSLDLVQGEVCGLLGPNGSGKTTILNMISGLSTPSSGVVSIMGEDITRNPRKIRSALGFISQETALYEELSAWKNMDFHADLFSIPRREKSQRITKLLEMVQLLDHKDSIVRTFSGGMKRRLAIARSLLHDPKLIYLDEPTIGVDVQARNVIWDYIRTLRSRGKTILITTNYLEEAEALCDRLAIIDHGRLVILGTTAHLKELYGGSILDIDTLDPKLAMGALQSLASKITIESNGAHLRISTKGTDDMVALIIDLVSKTGGIRRISMRGPNLDDIFLKLTGKALRD